METILSLIITKAYAAAPVLEPTGSIGFTNEDTLNISIGNLASLSIDWLYALAGAIAFISAIWFGIKYITSSGDSKKAGEARSGLLNVIIGIVVVVAAYAIIKFAVGLGLLLQNQVKNTSNVSSSSSSSSASSSTSSTTSTSASGSPSTSNNPYEYNGAMSQGINNTTTNPTTEVITEAPTSSSPSSSYKDNSYWSSIYGRIMGGE